MKTEQLYFSARLTKKMHEILHKPVTVVEAPAGYGKTSAVREALINLPAQQVHWFTAVNESSVVSYKRLCRALKKWMPRSVQP